MCTRWKKGRNGTGVGKTPWAWRPEKRPETAEHRRFSRVRGRIFEKTFKKSGPHMLELGVDVSVKILFYRGMGAVKAEKGEVCLCFSGQVC